MTATLRLRRRARVAGPLHRACGLIVAVVLVGATAACGGSSSSSTSTGPKSIVALGDSVPSGYNCKCTPYPQLSAQGLATKSGQSVTATNDAVGGYTTGDVLQQVDSNKAIIDELRTADVVEIEIGANDVPYNAKSCGTSVDCYAPLVPPVRKNLDAIVARVRDLTSGHKALVVLLDYWSIWLGGTYARDKGHEYVSAARRMTAQVDEAIRASADASGSAYVDLRRAFKGPSFGEKESKYLTSDGDHPNATGHQAIATATEAVIENALHI